MRVTFQRNYAETTISVALFYANPQHHNTNKTVLYYFTVKTWYITLQYDGEL